MRDVPLNEAQRRAVEHRGGPLLVLAGAGSGKTSVLTARLAYQVDRHGIPPQRILAVTFTNRAAAEMRRRVTHLLGKEPVGLWIGTFHSLSARLLRREAARLGFTPGFTIYDEADRLSLIKRILEERGHGPRSFPPRQIQSIVSAAKNKLITAAELAASSDDRFTRVAAETFHVLQQALARANAMDFDDLLLHPLTLFREHPDRLAYYQQRFDSILVDEFQDTNRAQYLLIRQLAERHRELCVVGDDDQSIYSWRGADVRNMLDFQHDFGEAELVRLEQNYRSTQPILDAANAVIAENRDRLGKTLFTARGGGEPLVVTTAGDERDEAEWIVGELRERAVAEQVGYPEMAVLYRTNAQSRALEEAFRRAGVPYRIVGSVGFYERREVKDLIAYLRLIVNPADDEAFVRAVQVPKRGIGITSLKALQDAAGDWKQSLLETAATADRIGALRSHPTRALQEFAALIQRFRRDLAGATPAELLERVLADSGYVEHLTAEGPEGMERLENVRELVAAAADWSEEVDSDDSSSPLERFLTNSALTESSDRSGGDPNGVTLMTVHTAKGLEWPVVAVTGMEEGLFPLSRALDTAEGLEEERRLAYVAITRARDRVYVTWARARRRGGQLLPGAPSRFLEALPRSVVEERATGGVLSDFRARTRRAGRVEQRHRGWVSTPSTPSYDVGIESQDAPRYVKGERVRHRSFGSGTIRALDGHGRALKVLVAFDDETVGTKQLLVAYAGLERDWESA
jgi:DNA helicase-2/ATP-dependent DNA helicase PcrA